MLIAVVSCTLKVWGTEPSKWPVDGGESGRCCMQRLERGRTYGRGLWGQCLVVAFGCVIGVVFVRCRESNAFPIEDLPRVLRRAARAPIGTSPDPYERLNQIERRTMSGLHHASLHLDGVHKELLSKQEMFEDNESVRKELLEFEARTAKSFEEVLDRIARIMRAQAE